MDDRERRPDGWVQPAPGSVRGRRVGFWLAIVLVSLIVGIGILGFVMSILTYG